jgi:hypothetical protein
MPTFSSTSVFSFRQKHEDIMLENSECIVRSSLNGIQVVIPTAQMRVCCLNDPMIVDTDSYWSVHSEEVDANLETQVDGISGGFALS